MTRKYAVAICAKPQTEGEKLFNLDGITFLNMLNGMSYEKAREQAKQEMKGMTKSEVMRAERDAFPAEQNRRYKVLCEHCSGETIITEKTYQ